MNLRHLEHLLAIADTGSFSRAAGRLFITQSALSRSIQGLESELGGPVLDRLDREHAAGEAMIRELGHALLAFEMMGRSRWDAFEDRLERYVRFYLDHMGTEEREVLPAAQARLSEQDWAELDATFTAHRDPLTGQEPEDDYREVFRRIVDNAPAPIGLGPEMHRAA